MAAAMAASQTPLPVRNGSAQKLGPYSPSQTIRLAIGLRPPHIAAEQEFLRELQEKSSPLFHQYLTTAEWTKRFGPTAAAQQAVVAWATGAGLTVTHLYPNRLVVDVAGNVGAIEHALGVQINSYRLGSHTFFANASDPVLPPALVGIVESVDGLSSLQTMFPASSDEEPASPAYGAGPVVAAGPHAAANGSRARLPTARVSGRAATPNITDGAYDPTDIYGSEAYDYNALNRLGHCCNPLGNSGSSPPQTSIAIATFGSQKISDIQGFQAQYPYLAYNVQEVYIDGTPACCDAEGTLDMEWATATSNSIGPSQDTAKVYLYDGANFNNSTFTDTYNQMVSDNAARVFSTSWSCTEVYGCSSSTMSTRDSIFSEMAGQGWSLVAGSGDRGAYDDCSHLAVSFPASDPNVVGAGGTELSLGAGPVYNSEVAWSGGPDGCGSNDGGSGGGCSAVFAAPSYQSNQPCGSGSRGVPDISLNADWFHTPQNYYFDGTLSGNGGTSIVAPELAGFLAQEDSYLLAEGNVCGSGSSACAPLGNANYPLYETGIDGAPHNPFYDVTSGCNTNDVGPGYCAGSGYDLVTGWGSANILQLAWAFNWHLLADDGRPTVAFSGPTPGVWYDTDETIGISVADTGGGFPASGVAGFSDAWNADPGDPTSEATPGAGNSFYDGPEFPGTTRGSLDLAAEGQGCHTVNVEAWDNMGLQSGDVTDGPLCYDTTAPSGTIKIDGGAASTANDALELTLSATNPMSGDPVSDMAFSVDGGPFGAFEPFSTSATISVPTGEGTRTVAVEYRNAAGTVGTSTSDAIYLVQTAPTITGVTPHVGSPAGGNTVTIIGTHFAPGATVMFSTTAASSVTFVSGTQLEAVAPAHAAGTVTVVVQTPAGLSAPTNSDLYVYGSAPKPSCTIGAKSSKVLPPTAKTNSRRTHKRPKGKPGTLRFVARCSQVASLTVTGKVTETLKAKKGKHHHRRAKTFRIAAVRGTGTPGQTITLTVNLPKAALAALKAGRRESLTVTLTATNANGTGTATATIKRLGV
jgi:kumamolisin